MAVSTRHLRFALLNYPIRNQAPFTKAELDPVIRVIRNGGKRKVPDDYILHKYFSYVPEFDQRGKLSDEDGDGDVDLKDLALYGMDRISKEEQPSEKHDEAIKRIEDIALSAGMEKLDRSEWFEVNLGNAVVSPPSGDALISVYVRGRRLCRLRASREQHLRKRLAQVSKLKTMIGLKEVKVDSVTLEMAGDDGIYGILRLPIRLFRGRVECALRRTRLNIENLFLNAFESSHQALRKGVKTVLPKRLLQNDNSSGKLEEIQIEAECAFSDRKSIEGEEMYLKNELYELTKREEENNLQARREIYEHVFITRRDSQTREILSIKLYKDVPRHKVTLLIPTHHVAIASSEQFFLLSLIGAGSVMPTYRSVHFALEQPWVANLVLGSLAASILKIIYSSFRTSRAYLDLEVCRYNDEYICASGGYSVFSVLQELAEEVEDNSTLLSYVVQKLNQRRESGSSEMRSSSSVRQVEEWLAEVFPERTSCEADWATKTPIVSATSRLFALGLGARIPPHIRADITTSARSTTP